MARLREHYNTTVRKTMHDEFAYANPMQIPKLTKIVLNMGVGEAAQDRKKIESAADEMTRIAGQKAVITKARKSIAGFKIRDGMTVGCKVTLRRVHRDLHVGRHGRRGEGAVEGVRRAVPELRREERSFAWRRRAQSSETTSASGWPSVRRPSASA